jgi:Ca2+-binding EF-hand superfamily protein
MNISGKEALERLTEEEKAELRSAFNLYDANGDGELTMAEIAGVMHKVSFI